MNNVINRMYEMFVRVSSFAEERAASLPEGTLAPEMLVTLKRVIEELTEAGTSQASGLTTVQRATAERMAGRETLRAGMQAWTRAARVMAFDTPGLENKFRLPRSGSDPALLQTARAFVADALPLKDKFLRLGMSPSFIEDLKEDIADLQRTMGEQNSARGSHVSATVTVGSSAEQGMVAVRTLDVIFRNLFRDDPAALAAWESARHVESPARTRKRTNGSAGGTSAEGDKGE